MRLLGQDKVLQSLHAWIVLAEKSERSRGVASAQFWRGLRLATNARGYIGGPALLLPPFFEWSIPADDAGLQIPLPSGARKPRRGRYIVVLAHRHTIPSKNPGVPGEPHRFGIRGGHETQHVRPRHSRHARATVHSDPRLSQGISRGR